METPTRRRRVLVLNRQQIIDTSIDNMLSTGIIQPDAIQGTRDILEQSPLGELFYLLLKSHELREEQLNHPIIYAN